MEDRLAELGMANDIPPEAAALVMACLAKEPGQRPPSARAVAEWIGLELEAKPTTESLAAALFPQTPSRPEAVAGEPAEDSPSTPAGDGGPPMPPGMLVPGRVSKGAGYGWKLAAVGIVALVIAGAFWLRRDNLRRNHSNPLAAAKVPGQTAELAPEQIPSTATPATPAAPAASAKTEAQPPPQKTVPNPAASNQPGWISSEVPKPGADGWIVLFDGKRLYGCSPPNADTASGKLIVQDGCLKVDSTSIRFNLTGRDLVIRARLKKVSGENCGISLRNDDKGGDCYAWFDGSNYFGLGRNIGGKPTNFVNIHAGENYDGFFEMEFRAEGRNLTLKADGRIICQAYDNSIIGGVCHAGTLNGITFFQSIEARILDKTPSTANVESQSRTAKVPPQEATTPPANPTEHNANAAATAVAGVPSSNVPAPAAVGQKETGPSTIGKAGSSGAKDAPRITSQPASQSVLPGANVTFKVTVAGDGPFTYQWRLDGAGLPDTIRTVAGNGKQGYSGDGGAAINASLNYPCGVALDAAGNLYIVDNNNERIRKVDTKGIITTVAGNGGKGYSGDGGPAANASLDTPYGVALDPAANLYIADRMNNRIRKLGAKGIITTVAGNGGRAYSGDGGPAANTSLNLPLDMAFDAAGSMYIADYVNQRIRMVDSQGIITTVAGNGNDGYSGDGGAASKASLSRPAGVAFDAADDLYIADCYNHRVRKLDSKGVITTVAGNGMPDYSGDGGAATKASLGYLHRLAFDAFGNLYIADSSNNRIRKVDINGIIATVAGNGYGSTTADVSGGGTYSGDGGAATSASLNYPFAVASDAFGRLYIADSSNHRIREVHLAGLPELAIIHVSATNAGNYTVVISNPHGSVTSAVAALTVKGTQP
jgi:sugar lactone lactonase YvrE